MTKALDSIVKAANEYRFIRIIPATNLDALLAASILSKNLKEHGINAPINIDPKLILDSPDEPLLTIDLPTYNMTNKHFSLLYDGETSISAHIVYYIDKVFGATRWDKILAILAGIYRGLDLGREGFKGLEKELLDELTKIKQISIDLGLRLWGWKKYSLPKALYRTLIPFIPGYSGDPGRTNNVLKNILGVDDPEKIMGEHILSFTEEGLEKTKVFLEKLSSNMEYVDLETRNKVLLKLLGYIYLVEINNYVIDLIEAMGALILFMSLSNENIYYTLLVGRDDLILYQALTYYNDIIDEIVVEITTSITQFFTSKKPIFESPDIIKRPEIYIDILKSIDKLPQNKPIIIKSAEQTYSNVNEFLRIKAKPDKIYSSCNEYQLCLVDENGRLIKA